MEICAKQSSKSLVVGTLHCTKQLLNRYIGAKLPSNRLALVQASLQTTLFAANAYLFSLSCSLAQLSPRSFTVEIGWAFTRYLRRLVDFFIECQPRPLESGSFGLPV